MITARIIPYFLPLAILAASYSPSFAANDFIDAILAMKANQNEKALRLFRASADRGNAKSQFWLGSIYEEGKLVKKDYRTAAMWFRKSANQGNADAQYNLSTMLISGTGGRVNYKEAAGWLGKAVSQGHSMAMADLGSLHQIGRGVRKSYKRAIELFQMAANKCNAVGQVNLGRSYVTGRGVRQNLTLAYKWFHVAASQGLGSEYIQGKEEGKSDRDYLFKSLPSSQVKNALRLAEGPIKKCLQWRINRL